PTRPDSATSGSVRHWLRRFPRRMPPRRRDQSRVAPFASWFLPVLSCGCRARGPAFRILVKLYPYPLRKVGTCPRAKRVCLKEKHDELFVPAENAGDVPLTHAARLQRWRGTLPIDVFLDAASTWTEDQPRREQEGRSTSSFRRPQLGLKSNVACREEPRA